MSWSSLPPFVRSLLRFAGGVAVLAVLYGIWQVSAPWRNPSAYNWTYAEAPGGHEQSLAITAKESTMGGANGDTFAPVLSIVCEDGRPNVSLELGLSMCIGNCAGGAVYDVSEFFVSDPNAASQFGASAAWHTTSASQAHATRFASASEPGAAEDAVLVAPFVHKLAAAKEFRIVVGNGEAKFDTAGLAAALPHLAKACPALK